MKRSAILEASRYNDWWGCKMSPLVAVGYGTARLEGISFCQATGPILLLIAGLVAGGIYASSINDLSDMEEDRVAGKENRLGRIPARYRWLFPVGGLAAGVPLAFYLLRLDVLTAVLYAMPCLCFTLYSLRPFRLKKRGFWGVAADAAGAHLFPGLCLVAGTSALSSMPVDGYWFALVGIWSACFGLRGILWHQFQDRPYDLLLGLGTFATRHDPVRFRAVSLSIFLVEVAAFGGMMWMLRLPLALPFAALYLFLVYGRESRLGREPGIIVTMGHEANRILLLDYYVCFFPLSLLIGALDQPYAWILLLLYLIAFPLTPLQMLRDTRAVFRSLLVPHVH